MTGMNHHWILYEDVSATDVKNALTGKCGIGYREPWGDTEFSLLNDFLHERTTESYIANQNTISNDHDGAHVSPIRNSSIELYIQVFLAFSYLMFVVVQLQLIICDVGGNSPLNLLYVSTGLYIFTAIQLHCAKIKNNYA
jgi:hypothetical protein